MSYIKPNGVPEIRFAHIFSADSYTNNILPLKGCIEISYVAQGTTQSRLDGVNTIASKYNVFCNLYNKPLFVESDAFHEHHTVSFKLDFDFCDKNMQNALFMPRMIDCCEYGKVHKLIDEIIRVHTLEPECEIKKAGLFFVLISEYSNLAEISLGEKAFTASLYVTRAKRYIYENLAKPITQRGLAKNLGVTPEYLCQVFKRAGEPSPTVLINQIKLARIRSVMSNEKLRLYKAAEMFGFSDPNYVSRLYKKYYGRNITDFSDKKGD